MAQPIYKVWLVKYKEPWYRLTPKEQQSLMESIGDSLKQVGAELLVSCTSVWASEEWLGWGVEKYPSIEAVQQHALNLYNCNWFEFIDSQTVLGVEMTPQAMEG